MKILLSVLDKLVTGISLFEFNILQLALFYLWYHEQLESNGNKICFQFLHIFFNYLLILDYNLEYIFPAVGNKIKDILKSQWEKIYHPVMSVARLLDSQYYEQKLSANSMSIISQFIQQ